MPTKQDCILDYAQTAGRRQYTRLIQEHLAQTYDAPPLALVHSFGCQQNAADGEKLRGMLGEMGYGFTDSLEEADFILYNTCAVRENAEKRVFGTVGALKHYKRQKPELLIALVGWMVVSAAFSFYVENFANYSVIYGALGTVIVLMMWLNLTALMLIMGAEINGVLNSLRGRRTPKAMDRKDSTGGGRFAKSASSAEENAI